MGKAYVLNNSLTKLVTKLKRSPSGIFQCPYYKVLTLFFCLFYNKDLVYICSAVVLLMN